MHPGVERVGGRRDERGGGHARDVLIIQLPGGLVGRGHALCAEFAGKQDGAVEKRDLVGVVHGAVEAQGHGEREGDDVAILPDAIQLGVGSGCGRDGLDDVVDRDGRRGGDPMRDAEAQPGAGRRGGGERQPDGVRGGEDGVEAHAEAALAPVEGRGDEEVYPERVLVMEVDGGVVARGVFDAGAGAAPRRALGAAVGFEVTGDQRHEVGGHAGVGREGGEDVVVERVLVEVGVGGGGSPLEQLGGELEHVVGVAGLGGGDVER